MLKKLHEKIVPVTTSKPFNFFHVEHFLSPLILQRDHRKQQILIVNIEYDFDYH